MKIENELRRLRSLTGTLEVLLSCALDLNLQDASQPLASAVFLLGDVKESIERVENMMIGGSDGAPAND